MHGTFGFTLISSSFHLFIIGKVFDDTGDFRNVLYIICVCSLLAGVIMALGIYVRSKCSDESEPRLIKPNTCFPKIQGVIPEFEKRPIAQYETAV